MYRIANLVSVLPFIHSAHALVSNPDWPYALALQGHLPALKEVANRAEWGDGFEDADAKAVLKHFIKQAAKGDPDGMVALGIFSDRGNADALQAIAHLAENGRADANVVLQRFIDRAAEGDPDGLNTFRTLSESGKAEAKMALLRSIR